MTRFALVLILLAGLNSTIGNMLLKKSRLAAAADIPWYEHYLSIYFVGALVFYVINLGLFSKALDSVPVSIGYPVLAASGFAMLAIAASLIFGERFGVWQIVGLALVTTGIFALAQTG